LQYPSTLLGLPVAYFSNHWWFDSLMRAASDAKEGDPAERFEADQDYFSAILPSR